MIPPGLLLVAEIVGGAASVASSPGYSGKTMPETCALFVYNFEIHIQDIKHHIKPLLSLLGGVEFGQCGSEAVVVCLRLRQ